MFCPKGFIRGEGLVTGPGEWDFILPKGGGEREGNPCDCASCPPRQEKGEHMAATRRLKNSECTKINHRGPGHSTKKCQLPVPGGGNLKHRGEKVGETSAFLK